MLNYKAAHGGEFGGRPWNPLIRSGPNGFLLRNIYEEIEEERSFFGYIKTRKPVKDTRIDDHRMVWAPGRKGLERAKKAFEHFYRNAGIYFLRRNAKAALHSLDQTYSRLENASLKEIFLEQHPGYEPE